MNCQARRKHEGVPDRLHLPQVGIVINEPIKAHEELVQKIMGGTSTASENIEAEQLAAEIDAMSEDRRCHVMT